MKNHFSNNNKTDNNIITYDRPMFASRSFSEPKPFICGISQASQQLFVPSNNNCLSYLSFSHDDASGPFTSYFSDSTDSYSPTPITHVSSDPTPLQLSHTKPYFSYYAYPLLNNENLFQANHQASAQLAPHTIKAPYILPSGHLLNKQSIKQEPRCFGVSFNFTEDCKNLFTSIRKQRSESRQAYIAK